MESRVNQKPVVVSKIFEIHRMEIYSYSLETFGYFQAETYDHRILQSIQTLSTYYKLYPECRFLRTKKQIYRNIILEAHYIIYRITDDRIEVLDILHMASSIKKIRDVRNLTTE